MKNQQQPKIAQFIPSATALALGLVASLLFGCASKPPPPLAPTFNAADYKMVSVVVLLPGEIPFGRDGGARAAVDAIMQEALIQKGYTLAERTNIAQIIDEQALQDSGFTKSQTSKLGNAVAAPGQFVVQITSLECIRYGWIANVTAKLVDTNKGITLWSKSERAKTGGALAVAGTGVVGGVIGAVGGAAIGKGTGIGTSAGGVIGGAAGALGGAATADALLSKSAVDAVEKAVRALAQHIPEQPQGSR